MKKILFGLILSLSWALGAPELGRAVELDNIGGAEYKDGGLGNLAEGNPFTSDRIKMRQDAISKMKVNADSSERPAIHDPGVRISTADTTDANGVKQKNAPIHQLYERGAGYCPYFR